MAKTSPVYRTDTLACSLNPGKLKKIRGLVELMRTVAEREAIQQWAMFFRSRWDGFENVATKGWSRPWVQAKTLPAILAQMVMNQVGSALKGHMGQVKNTYRDIVSGSTVSPDVRHQLHSLNRRELWFVEGPVTLEQEQLDPVTGALKKAKVVISKEVKHLARVILRRALVQHRWPNFRRFQFQLDQRASWVQAAHTAKHGHWLMLSLGDG